MSGDDCSAGQELAMDVARKLHAVNPEHELLHLFTHGGEGCDEERFNATWEAFQVRFGKPGITKEQRQSSNGQAYFWAHYYLALKGAVDVIQPAVCEIP
jgi:hypothetical protein